MAKISKTTTRKDLIGVVEEATGKPFMQFFTEFAKDIFSPKLPKTPKNTGKPVVWTTYKKVI